MLNSKFAICDIKTARYTVILITQKNQDSLSLHSEDLCGKWPENSKEKNICLIRKKIFRVFFSNPWGMTSASINMLILGNLILGKFSFNALESRIEIFFLLATLTDNVENVLCFCVNHPTKI